MLCNFAIDYAVRMVHSNQEELQLHGTATAWNCNCMELQLHGTATAWNSTISGIRWAKTNILKEQDRQ